MRKLLLAILLSITTALADSGIYLKKGIGLNHINKSYHKDSTYNGNLRLKHLFPVISLGAGYQFNNNLRVEAMMDYYFLFSQSQKSKAGDCQFKLNLDTKITDFMVNIHKSIDVGSQFRPFIGLGLGIASIKDEGTGYMINQEETQVLAPTYGRQVYRAAYRLGAGIEYNFHDRVIGEVSYNYYDLGQSKPKSVNGINNILKRRFNVHNVSLGVRFLI